MLAPKKIVMQDKITEANLNFMFGDLYSNYPDITDADKVAYAALTTDATRIAYIAAKLGLV